ncbi:hypothetical protein MRB53_011072 [Persea americana]|uniref:Uncharacterized protein n=1 Tax=Persea americana TaxID=3435 RepID=A0ACC2LTT2_PERAE|nr:hypothetical protein MRB53_011072 [Persea americana]
MLSYLIWLPRFLATQDHNSGTKMTQLGFLDCGKDIFLSLLAKMKDKDLGSGIDLGTNEDPAIGIDLGTTYSCVAIWLKQHQRVEIITDDLGNRMIPSCVAFTKTKRLTGEGAKNQASKNHVNTLYGKSSVFKAFYILSHSSIHLLMLYEYMHLVDGVGSMEKKLTWHVVGTY